MYKILFFCFFTALNTLAQEIPPLQNFTAIDYNGENQNWAISQTSDKHIYVANNHSLLAYNGVAWRKYPSPNNSIIRAVLAKDSLVFVGQYMEFGYWQPTATGALSYHSISENLPLKMAEDEEFWNLLILKDWVLFQSLDRIYSYNLVSKEFSWFPAKSTKAHLFKVDDTAYYQAEDKAVYKIKDGKALLEIAANDLSNKAVVGMYKEDRGVLIILDNGELHWLQDGEVSKAKTQFPNAMADILVYTTVRLRDGTYVLGTIADGMFQIDSTGHLVRSISRKNGLNNNTILSLFQDNDDNLWLGLDNGISVININAPFNEYIDNSGALGLVYAAIVFEEQLYLGTNQGLFVQELGTNKEFELVRGTEGQVWSLTQLGDALFCGHNNGTYLVFGNTAKRIASFPGTWGIKPILGKPNLLLQGNFNGLSVLERTTAGWQFRNKIAGFDISSRFFELDGANQVIVNHEIKGLYRLTLDEDFRTVKHVDTHAQMGYGSSIFKFKDELYYASVNGVFKKDITAFTFSEATDFNTLLVDEAGGITSIALSEAKKGNVWFFTNTGVSRLGADPFSGALSATSVAVPSFFRRSLGVAGFENLRSVREGISLIGISNGFVTVDLDKREKRNYTVAISEVKASATGINSKVLALREAAKLNYEANTVSFSYTVPQYNKYAEVSYQYKLSGFFEDWSAWSSEPNVSFSNLDFGDYNFEVRARVGNTLTENSGKYRFTIVRPWYASIWAICGYVFLLILFFYGLHKLYARHYARKQKQAEREERRKLKRKKLKTAKELAQLKNEKLSAEIEGKNRELAVSTMSIIKKNEFLNHIKGELAKADNPTRIKSVIKTIDRNITNDEDWKFFEEAFNNADKDFLKKIKKSHPELTPNDLKLCAYLRLNLASKEIAPLLNISVRSVEVKRYRLRKKMGLPHESSLTTYIMER